MHIPAAATSGPPLPTGLLDTVAVVPDGMATGGLVLPRRKDIEKTVKI